MSYKSAALKSLSAVGILYLAVVCVYGSLVITSSNLRDPSHRGRTADYLSISATKATVYGETDVSPAAPTRGIESRTPSIFGYKTGAPETTKTYSASPSPPAYVGEKRSASEVHVSLSNPKQQVTKVEKAIQSGSQVGQLTGLSPGIQPSAKLSSTTHQMIKAESKEKGLEPTDGLN